MSTAPRPVSTAPVAESGADDLAAQRFLLDLALQPLARFEGFNRIEQIGGSALRYQLNFAAYALTMAQYTRTPAFTGYLAEAQRNLIRKMCDKRVWGYWATESMFGYGRRETDPIRHANVMYSGYFGVMVGLYETLNDAEFSRSGALPLVWNARRTHSYDFRTLATAIRANMLARPDCPQYACEPHLIYPICNTFAFNTLLMHDRLHGSELTGDLVERVRRSYLEDGWRRPSGRFVPGRLGPRVTLCPPVLAYDAGMALWLHPAMPDLAHGTWRFIRDRHIDVDGPRPHIRGKDWMRVDLGNYNWTRGDGITRAFLITTAREMGDTDLADALQQAMDEDHEVVWRHGARRYAEVSTVTNAHAVLARFTRPGAVRDLVNGVVPEQWRTGPLLAEAAYPDVLVAKAVTDGRALELVLHPGEEPCRTRLGVHRLTPHAPYSVRGGVADLVRADADGVAIVEVDLGGRTEVRLAPA